MDFIAGLFELTGLWLVGKKKWIGFLCNIVGCSIWIYVAIETKLFGLLMVVVPAIIINAMNIRRWINTEAKIDDMNRN